MLGVYIFRSQPSCHARDIRRPTVIDWLRSKGVTARSYTLFLFTLQYFYKANMFVF